MAYRFFWHKNFTDPDSYSLAGIDAEDCLGDNSNIQLVAGCAAVVENGGKFYF